MKAEVKDLWVSALNSEKYEQGSGYLHQVKNGTGKLCCLGVLCDLAVNAGVILPPTKEVRRGRQVYLYQEGATFLPLEVVEWAGLQRADPGPEQLGSARLSFRNDRGISFWEIARVIEEHWESM